MAKTAPKRSRVDELRDKPTLTPHEAFELLRMTETTGYRAIEKGTFPVPVIRCAPRTLRIPTAAVLRLLGEEV
jgi:predicted DNA-binding transcriptional regulator AlpA